MSLRWRPIYNKYKELSKKTSGIEKIYETIDIIENLYDYNFSIATIYLYVYGNRNT